MLIVDEHGDYNSICLHFLTYLLNIWWVMSDVFCSKFHMLSSSANILKIG